MRRRRLHARRLEDDDGGRPGVAADPCGGQCRRAPVRNDGVVWRRTVDRCRHRRQV